MNVFGHVYSVFMNLIKSFLWVYYDTETLYNPEFYLKKRKEKGEKNYIFPPNFFSSLINTLI